MHAVENEGYRLEPSASSPAPVSMERPAEPSSSQQTMGRVMAQRRSAFRAVDERRRRESVRNAYRIPLLMISIGMALTCLVLLVTRGWSSVGAYAVSFLGSVPVGLVVYLVCCAIWIGSNERLHLVFLQLIGVYAVTDAALAVLGHPPLFSLFWFIVMLAYVGLLSEQLDIELKDAIIVGLLTFLTKQLIAMGIVAAAL